MILVINELSYSESVSKAQAKTFYDSFFQLCLKVEKEYRTKLNLKYSTSPTDYIFHQDFTFHQWLSSQIREEKSSFLSMLTKEPIIHDYPYYKAYGKEGKGIGYAYENDELLISFMTSADWAVDFIPILQEQISEVTYEIENEEVDVRNYFCKENIIKHHEYVIVKLLAERNNLFNDVCKGSDIWSRRGELFPNLIFCDSTEQFISGSAGNFFRNIYKKFKEYEAYFSNWNQGDFEKDSLSGNVRLESDTRINDFNNELTIICPDGQNRLFSLHCNIGIDGYRMHFYPDTLTRKCIIGYIGKKIT